MLQNMRLGFLPSMCTNGLLHTSPLRIRLNSGVYCQCIESQYKSTSTLLGYCPLVIYKCPFMQPFLPMFSYHTAYKEISMCNKQAYSRFKTGARLKSNFARSRFKYRLFGQVTIRIGSLRLANDYSDHEYNVLFECFFQRSLFTQLNLSYVLS